MIRIRMKVLGAVCVMALAACSSSGTGVSAVPVSGGAAVFAEQAGNAPNYIFPFVSAAYYTVPNVRQFQYLMYRPLYWFGSGNSLGVDYPLSLAYPATWAKDGLTVTVRLRPYRWSDGTSLSPSNVAFWMGLATSEKKNSAYYIPGQFPDNVSSVAYDNSSDSFTMHLKSRVSAPWFLYNELSQITPLPVAWDRAAAGVQGTCSAESPGEQAASCPRVYSYLISQANDQAAYATSPLWGVVDGPFRLSAYSNDGNITFVPNQKYSGPVRPKISKLELLPFTSDAAEYNYLRSSRAVSIGYIPPEDVPSKPAGSAPGHNPLSPSYGLYPQPLWGFYYLLLNFNNPTVGPLFHQLYIRQALQSVVNQPADVVHALSGYGYEQYGPISPVPSNPFVDSYAEQGPLRFSISRARQLLTSHGWAIKAGVATCVRPGAQATDCGQRIFSGEKLAFSLINIDGPVSSEEMEELVSDAAQAGITIKLSNLPPKQLVAETAQCTPSQAACTWQISNYGGNNYATGFPSGAQTFQCSAGLNVGSYCDPEMDRLIQATTDIGSKASFVNYQNYAVSQVPVLWMASQYLNLAEVASNLKGATPVNALGSINPENWYFTK